MKTKHIIILSTILIIITILCRITHHTSDSPDPQPRIDSLQHLITTYQDSIANLQLQRDTIRDTITHTRTIRIQVPTIINHMPPDTLIATFNNLTRTTSTLLETGEALVPLPAIRQSTIAITENPLLKKEIHLLEKLTTNQNKQLTLQDSIITQHLYIDTLRQSRITTLEKENAEKDGKVRRWKIISAITGVVGLVLAVVG